jgi:TolB-like protein
MSSDPEQDYFADGMVEDLITSLSRFKTFGVVARNSSFVYKNRAVDIREAANALGVRYVLEGSVRRTERQVRVNAQLIDGATGAHLWAEKLDGAIEDVFAFQDSVTENVVGLIEPQIRRAEIERSRRKRPESLDAYDLYLQALPLMQGGQSVLRLEDYSDAILLFERAVALDPGFAPALAYAAWSHEKRLTRGGVAPPGVDDAREAVALAERAVAADNTDAVVLVIAGLVLVTVQGDLDEGLALIRRALALNPNSLLIANVAGYAHFHCGKFDESIACHFRGLQFSSGLPDTFWSLNGIARAHLAAGRVEEALTWGLRGLEAYSGVDFAHCIVAAAYAHLGRLDKARTGLDKARSIWPGLTVATLLGRSGDPEGRDRFLVEGLLRAGLPAS